MAASTPLARDYAKGRPLYRHPWSALRHLASESLRYDRKTSVGVLFAAILEAALRASMILLIGKVISAAAADKDLIVWMVIYGIVVGVINSGSVITDSAIRYLVSRVDTRRRTILTKAMASSSKRVLEANYLDKVSLATEGSRASGMLLGDTARVVSQGAEAIAIFVVVGLQAPISALLILAAVFPYWLFERYESSKYADMAVKDARSDRSIMYIESMLRTPGSALEVGVAGSADKLARVVESESKRKQERRLNIWHWRLLHYPLIGLVQQALLVFALLSMVLWRDSGISPGTVAVVIQSFFGLTGAVFTISLISALQRQLPSVAGYDDFCSRYGTQEQQPILHDVAAAPQHASRRLDVQDLAYSYGDADFSLSGVSFSLRPGELVALVGANGSGKTTLVRLLAKIYTPTSGTVRLDGLDYSTLSDLDVHANVAVLFQDFARFNLSVYEAVSMGVGDTNVDRAAVWNALERAHIAAAIRALPEGLDTQLGLSAGDGRELSGGQWQRLALARLYLRNAPIWLLDEPTSALDAEAESEVFEDLQERLADRACLIVSHRLWTVRRADHILVLKNGSLVQHGRYKDLLDDDGEFMRLFRFQHVD